MGGRRRGCWFSVLVWAYRLPKRNRECGAPYRRRAAQALLQCRLRRRGRCASSCKDSAAEAFE